MPTLTKRARLWRWTRRGRLPFLFALLTAVFAAGGAAWAQTVTDPFVVQGIAVDATAADANQAREIAINNGMREAFQRMVRRMVPREQYSRLPDPRATDLAAMAFSFQVENERTSPTRYLANLSVTFKRDEVRALLQRTAIPFAETASRPVLVVPVYNAAGTSLLWDDPNPWRQSWAVVRGRDSLSPMVLPSGDLTDVGTISAAQALAGDRTRLTALARRYGVEDVVVAEATLRFEIGSRVPSVDVVLRRFGPAGEGTTIEAYRGDAAEPVQGLLQRAVETIVLGIEERWKRENLLVFGSEATLSATVPLASLTDWVQVRQRLERSPEIKAVRLAEVSTTSAQVVLHYFGDAGRLVVALAQRGLVLGERDGFWTLTLRPSAPRE